MRTLPLALVSPALVLGVTQHALGQTETDLGSRIPVPKRANIPYRNSTEEAGRIIIREYARCTVATSPERVSEALMLSPGEDEQALGRLASNNCLSAGMMRFGAPLFRGALMAEMFRRSIAQPGRPWTYPRPVLPEMGKTPPAGAPKELQINLYMLDLADCLYKAAPDAVREIVIQPIGSERQKSAFRIVIPQLGPCVVEGQSLSINRQALENAFGEYLYRSGAA